jgi:alginate O-acetyltransferase complex protein AlgI
MRGTRRHLLQAAQTAMLFHSFEFLLVFLPAVLLGFFVLGGRGDGRFALGWLILASLVFYVW